MQIATLPYCAVEKYNINMPQPGIDGKSKKLFLELLKNLNADEREDMLSALLSSAEIKDISRRLMASKLLHSGLTYEEVQDIMGMSSNTVNKIYFKTKGCPILRKKFRKD